MLKKGFCKARRFGMDLSGFVSSFMVLSTKLLQNRSFYFA